MKNVADRRYLVLLFVLFLCLDSTSAKAEALSWEVTQVTHFGSGSGDGPFSPDINNAGEIVYGFPNDGSEAPQIFSTTRGQLTFSDAWQVAYRPRINNAGEVIFIGAPAIQDGGNVQIYNVNGSRVDLGPSFIAANNDDFNDHGEVIGLGLDPSNNTVLVSSAHGILVTTGGAFNTSVSINNKGEVLVSPFAMPLIPGVTTNSINFSNNDLRDIVFQDGNNIKFWDGAEVSTVFQGYSIGGLGFGEPRMNDERDIVFQGVDSNGFGQIYLATLLPPPPPNHPIPEASTVILVGLGLLILFVKTVADLMLPAVERRVRNFS